MKAAASLGWRRRARAVLGRVALVVASVVVTALALEAVLRVAVPHWRGLVPQQFMTATEGGVLAGVPNFDGRIASLFGDFDVPLRFDARGFRNPPDADPAAPLAFIGDSFCQGWGVAREQSFPALVAQRLGVPFYNYCTAGADLVDELNILRTWLPPRHDGTTVLTVTFENDVLAYPDSAGEQGTTASVQGLSRSVASRWLMNHSALFDVTTTLARQSPTIVALVPPARAGERRARGRGRRDGSDRRERANPASRSARSTSSLVNPCFCDRSAGDSYGLRRNRVRRIAPVTGESTGSCSTARPPGRSTRRISRNADGASGRWCAAPFETTRS